MSLGEIQLIVQIQLVSDTLTVRDGGACPVFGGADDVGDY